MDIVNQPVSEEDERKLKSLATRIMSNGVEVLVKDKQGDNKADQIYPIEEKTIQPSTPSNMFMSNLQKIEKRIDNPDNNDAFDLIQPSEPYNSPCKSSCPCPHTKTESLNTQYTLHDHYDHHMPASKYGSKVTKYVANKEDLRPTKVESTHKNTQYGPYEYENSQLAPTDRIVQKYTEVINDYSDEKESNSVEQSELLTNEQAPSPPKTNRTSATKLSDKKPEKHQKLNKNKVLVADLIKLGSLGIKSLSQLAPVFEKMTGGFIKRQETNRTTTTTTTTLKPEQDLTAYHVNKRVDNEIESKQSNFPIYIPVDLDTSESQLTFTNATLHQNLAWAVEHKQPKSHIILPKVVHESPLVNGGIPISPGEVITANSDVIVGKPAVGGPLTLAASGMKLHNPVNPPPIDSFVAANEQYLAKEKPALSEQDLISKSQGDDSFDLRPPELPKPKPNRMPRPNQGSHSHFNHPPQNNRHPPRIPPPLQDSDYMMKTEHAKSSSSILGNHGRPAFLDYIPSLDKQKANTKPKNEPKPTNQEEDDQEFPDNNPSSSEIVSTRVTPDGHINGNNHVKNSKPFLVDIQPSKVANVLIPHGSATALVFAGSSEPHKTGDYVDDPLPYPEPGYFGTFSIDAPQLTNVQNVPPKHYHNKQNSHPPLENYKQNIPLSFKEQPYKNELKVKWKDTKRPINYGKIPPPTSNQETHVQVGPKITAYNPDIYRPNNGDFENYHRGRPQEHKDTKKVIDNEYENYLAVPPLPPPKMHFSQDSHYEKKPYSQRPTVHTKPIQDMNIYLNIQHPVPKPNLESLPPKVTSEIYFAAQAPNTKSTPTYLINIPPSHATYGNHYSPVQNYQQTIQSNSENIGPPSNSFTVISSPNFVNKSVFTNDIVDKDNSYSVTLNTATNVASDTGENAQVIGSSMPVPIGSSSNIDQLNTNIPIGTNFAIHVEDESSSFDGQTHQGNDNQENHSETLASVGDNRWNQSSTEQDENYDSQETTINDHHNFNQNIVNTPSRQENVKTPIPSSVNSHANFPMTNDESEYTHKVKPVTEVVDELKIDQKRPAKLIPNVLTNSHGWYSSVLENENNINNINVESTTRKMIPLIHEYNRNSAPEFGQKIQSAGQPPSEFWAHTHNTHSSNKHDVGKPFVHQVGTEQPSSSLPPLTSKPYNSNYIPSYFSGMKQPAYDIPVRDNSDETTTTKQDEKLVYENSEEVYDGEDEQNLNDNEDDASSESIKVPVITTSSEEDRTNTTRLPSKHTLSQDKYVTPTKDIEKYKHVQFIDYSAGTQTEKPFGYSNNTSSQPDEAEPIYNQMKPRPFTISTVLDHQLQQPHWQINQLMVNSTNISYEENLELNTGEEMKNPQTKSPSTQIPHRHIEYDTSKYKRPPRPVYVNHNDHRDDPNIITSIVHINDKRPLFIEDSAEKSTISPALLSTLELNRSSSEIIDLSPPPPTIDYNFKPSTNDEMIMGMSPPPPRTQPPIRTPSRLPSTPRPIPIRTPPPYRTKPPRTLPPRIPSTPRPIRRPIHREEVSTYRPHYDTIGNVKRPIFNRDHPSSQLLPPPRELPSRVTPVNDLPPPTMNPEPPTVIFPTPTLISSGWMTSSGIDFSSNFDFAPTSVHFPGPLKPSDTPKLPSSTTEDSYSYEVISSSERVGETSTEKASTEMEHSSQGVSTESSNENKSSEDQGTSETAFAESSKEDTKTTTDKMKVIPLGNRHRTRKPYPVRSDDKSSSTNKYKSPSRPTIIIKPTRTLSKPEILFPTRQISTTRRIIRPPVPPRLPPIVPSIIESSESPINENYVGTTEILKENIDSSSTLQKYEKTSTIEKSSSVANPTVDEIKTSIVPTQQVDHEEVSEEIVPTKTEFRTTVVTLTKTLSEPPKTVSSIGYVNLTHTLTVTHTMTSLVSKSEGAITQTLVLTNTHTSTIVDVITKVQTEVQPTTIVETVTKHIPIPHVEPTSVQDVALKTKIPLDDVTISSEEEENLIIKQSETTENIQKIQTEQEGDNDTFFVVMNKSQNGGKSPPISTDIETSDYEITRNEQVNNNGVSQVLFGEILLAGTPYLETTNVVNSAGAAFSKECQPDCKASRNERCQRIDGIMKCVCRPGFARMFPDRPCKPTYTYSVKLALGSQGNERLEFHDSLADNSSKQYHALAVATHEGINRMIMQSDLRDVYHGVHITGFHPVEMKDEDGDSYQGVVNDFYVQLSDNAHESRLKEVIEKYLRHNNYSLGVTDVHAAGGFMEKLEVNDFDECTSPQFHDCSEHAQCFNLRGTYTCSCLEGYADLSVNSLYPGRICSAEPVGCERCNYHGSCYSRDDQRVLCECFQWYAGSACHINLKVVLISLVVLGAMLTLVLTACAIVACRRPRPPTRSIVTCIQTMPSLHQGGMPSKQRADRRALICDRADSGDASSVQNASLPYMPAKQRHQSKKCVVSNPPAHDPPPPPPAPAVMIPRARLQHHHHADSRENVSRKKSMELSSEAKLINYLESGAVTINNHDEMRRKHSMESSYSAPKDRHGNKQGALVSAGFKVSTTIRPDEPMMMKGDRDDMSSINKNDLEAELHFDSLRKSYSQEDMSEWTDAERRIGELTLSEARSVGGTLPASTGRAASSTRLTHQEANTMAERDLGSTFLLPHVHLYKPDLTSDVSEFDSL